MKFEVGQKVRCVSSDYQRLKKGEIYTVDQVDFATNYIHVEGVKGWWFVWRFEPVESGPPTGFDMSPPQTSADRKEHPVYAGFVQYFPAAMFLVARLSKKGNDKHNPGQPLHHNRSKSVDHGDCLVRHQTDVGTIDPDSNMDHAVEVAWRAMAQLQELAEKQYGWPKAPRAK